MRRVLWVLLFALSTLPGYAQSETDELFSRLSRIRLDRTQLYNIRDITIRRDVFAITFTRGTIAFVEPVNGKVTGAVFVGSGDIVAIPPDNIEKQQLYRFTRSPLLTESFDTAFFRFTDDTYEEILREYRDRAQEDVTPDEREQFLPYEQELGAAEGVLNYRIIADFQSTVKRPLFLAQLNTEKYGWFNAIYDERLAEEVSVAKTFEADNEFGGIWASFNRRTEERDAEAAANEDKTLIDVLSYTIHATIEDALMEATATVRFIPRFDGERVLPFLISPNMTISSVTTETGEPLPFHQKEGLIDDEVRRLAANHFIVVMPEAIPVGREVVLKFGYSGEGLRELSGSFVFAGDNGPWYPATDVVDRADYTFTLRYPADYSVVASGTRVREADVEGGKQATWENSSATIVGFVAGEVLPASSDPSLKTIVTVSDDARIVFRDTDQFRPAVAATPVAPLPPPGPRRNRTRDIPPAPVLAPVFDYGIDLDRFRSAMSLEVAETVTFLERIFGEYPFGVLNVTPLATFSRDGFPSFVPLGSVSFLDDNQRGSLNIPEGVFSRSEVERVSTLARQWLGHSVRWKTYRDQWIFEGLAAYAAMMYVDQKHGSGRLALELDQARGRLQEDRGAIWVGRRLNTGAVANLQHLPILESKGAWVMHMLRGLMGDDLFFAAVREFVQEFEGKSASTFDFKRILERRMPAGRNIDENGTLDWFFDNWVFGAGIPIYSVTFDIQPEGEAFAITGKISQSGVPNAFVMPVPVFADGELLGVVQVGSDEGEFRFTSRTRPGRIELDPRGSILSTRQ